MADEPTTYREGQTATNPKTGQRVVFRKGMWVNDTTYRPANGILARPKPSAQDQRVLAEASSRAQSERDARRTYGEAERAVEAMGTGPYHAAYLDAITPEETDGFWATVGDRAGALLGAPLRALVSNETLEARDHLRTVSAGVALEGSGQMKGASSDKDTALMRMGGVSPYKSVEENRRIIREAHRSSGLEEVRATATANWITKFGSLAAPGPNGWTFQRYLQRAEKYYNERQDITERGGTPPPPRRPRPTPPPNRRGQRTVTIDLAGNVVE